MPAGTVWAVRWQMSWQVAAPARTHLAVVNDRKGYRDFPGPFVVRTYEGTCLLWWRRKLTYRTPVAIFIPAGVRTKPCRTLPRLVPKAESRERISSSGIQIGACTIFSST